MNTFAMLQRINKFDAQWSKIKDNNPEMGESFSIILEDNFGQEVKLVFNRWVLDTVETPKNRNIDHPFRIGQYIDNIKQIAFIKQWKISSF